MIMSLKNLNTFLLPLLSSFLLLGATPHQKERVATQKLKNDFDPQRAVGVVEVFLYKNKNLPQRCIATHLGNGLMMTAGHCFLGAYDCNNARVLWENESYASRCQYIIYSQVSESYSKGQELFNDLTLFQVDRFPQASLSAAPVSAQDLSTTSSPREESSVAISAESPAKQDVRLQTSFCKTLFGPATTIFLQPKPSDSAKHDCALGNIRSGAPLLQEKTWQILAIHQGAAILPFFTDNDRSEAKNSSVNFAKIITDSRVKMAINLPTALPQNIRIGGFAPEVFSMGISEPLQLAVANIQASVGQQTVSFAVHNGLDTVLEAIDADDTKIIFAGPRRAGYEQRFRMKAPVKISLTSTPGGTAPLAWIEDIRSP